jgi:hypothetical protein
MNLKLLLGTLAAVLLPLASPAQQAGGGGSLQIRAVLHDPVNPVADLYLPDQTGQVVKLKLIGEGLSEPQTTTPLNGSLVLYHKPVSDPKNPGTSLAATARIPAGMKRAIIVVVPAAPDTKPAYRMVLIDDSPGAFPGGESRVLSLVSFEAALQAGEHKLPLKPASVTKVPAVKQVSEFNMAQTNFYYKEGPAWVAFTERQLQYLDEFRRIFLVYLTPGSTQPFVTTIVDTAPATLPK